MHSTKSTGPPFRIAYRKSLSCKYKCLLNVSKFINSVSLFLGFLGIHRFYVGKIGTGILWLFTLGFLGIGSFIDLLLILTGNFVDKQGKILEYW